MKTTRYYARVQVTLIVTPEFEVPDHKADPTTLDETAIKMALNQLDLTHVIHHEEDVLELDYA